MNCNILILAGGFGERLWPVSSKDFPKQFMALEGGLSFLQQSLERAFLLNPDGNILIVTRIDILDTTIAQCSSYAQTLSNEQRSILENKLIVIAEPCPKHTAPPVALACRYFEARQKAEKPLLVLTSDHIIAPFDSFNADVCKALEQAQNGKFVCFAISPTEAATGFGYIETDISPDDSVLCVKSFKEKPDAATAQSYLDSGNYWWNSGMFCVLPSVFMQELALYEENLANLFDYMQKKALPDIQTTGNIQHIENWSYMTDAYNKTLAISIDHAVVEKTQKACAVRATFFWQDIGTWDSFAQLFNADDCQNSGQGTRAQTDSSNCFVYSDVPIVLCGVQDIIVTVKNGKVLVMKKGSSDLIKETVQKLENN